jgi:predicted metal-dependent HD superfamily phosphohydrolase
MADIPSPKIESVMARYLEPHRHYHSLPHPKAMMRHLETIRGEILDWPGIVAATWWHDSIYDPSRNDNEERSAQLLRVDLNGLVPSEVIEFASAAILATAKHTLPEGLSRDVENDVAIFLDVDMSILAAPGAVYDQYEAGIAAEYVPVYGIDAYRKGRIHVLGAFLERARIFLTDRFYTSWEDAARRNVERAIIALETASGTNRR